MDASEPVNGKEQEQHEGVSIHVNSPNNRIAGRDYIEVNIHVGGGRDRSSRTRHEDQVSTTAAALVGCSAEIRQLIEHAIEERMLPSHPPQEIQIPAPGKTPG